ncbi:MAG: hypothetical protein IKU07_05475 [Oscillospiraceae bacterium]|nr:hypothetical protein [Oscillospiraceae bacterium]
MKNKSQRICKKIFAVMIIVTLLSMLILPGMVFAWEKSDGDAFLDGMFAAWTFILLLVMLAHEIVYYNALNYFLGDATTKTKRKSVLFALLFLVNTVFVVLETLCILNLFFSIY